MNVWKFNGVDVYFFLWDCFVYFLCDEKEFFNVILRMVKFGFLVKVILFKEYVFDLMLKEDIEVFEKYLKNE